MEQIGKMKVQVKTKYCQHVQWQVVFSRKTLYLMQLVSSKSEWTSTMVGLLFRLNSYLLNFVSKQPGINNQRQITLQGNLSNYILNILQLVCISTESGFFFGFYCFHSWILHEKGKSTKRLLGRKLGKKDSSVVTNHHHHHIRCRLLASLKNKYSSFYFVCDGTCAQWFSVDTSQFSRI